MRTSKLLIIEDAPPSKSASADSPRKPNSTTANANANANSDIIILHKHIRALRAQLVISHNDLAQLSSFLEQPLLEGTATTAYTAARRSAAVEYAVNTLGSISDLVMAVGTHVSGAEIRLRLLCGRFGCGLYPSTEGSLRRLEELMEQVWELHDAVKKDLGTVLLLLYM